MQRDPNTLPVGWGQGGRPCRRLKKQRITDNFHSSSRLRPGVEAGKNGLHVRLSRRSLQGLRTFKRNPAAAFYVRLHVPGGTQTGHCVLGFPLTNGLSALQAAGVDGRVVAQIQMDTLLRLDMLLLSQWSELGVTLAEYLVASTGMPSVHFHTFAEDFLPLPSPL